MIEVFKPAMGQEEIDAVAEVLRSGWIGLGPKTAEFEREFARYVGVSHAVAVNSATAALDLAMHLLDIGRGDEVIVPTVTFVSTAHAVAYNLGTPIFVDCDPVTLNLDLADVARKITRRTRAIIAVHYAGRPVDMDALVDTAEDIPIVEDAAHACGAVYKGNRAGSLGDLACFSFHAVKNLAAGDGGALTFSDGAWDARARKLRWLGIDKSTWDRTALDRKYWWQYNVEEIGLKCHMNDITAAIALAQLAKLERHNARRREIAERYFAGLAGVDEVSLPPRDDEDYQSAWHIFWIKAKRRDDLSVHLRDNGINTGVHYTPIHTYPCYGNRPHLPVAEQVQHELLSLPMYPDLVDADVDRIVSLIRTFYKP
ncbi:MAG: DegT/DnrJ/EryC1/StrS family aminotransferase [Candidatus Sericytochromatia bacterium]|nr:DegT/DnrJ/EryC1/StrS family aminotransferase [Candidatus Tanganyikabacteria bacterium]